MDKKSLYLVIGVMTLAVVLAVFEMNSNTKVDLSISDAKNNQSVKNNATVSELTKQLLTVAHDLRKATPEQHDALLEQLITLAKSRQTQMRAIAATDPDAIVKNTIPGSVKKQLPEDVLEFIEDSAELSGELRVVIGEDDKDKVIYDYTIKENGKTTKLNMGGFRDNLITGQKVKVKGTFVAGEMAVATDSASVTVTSQPLGEPTTNKKVAAILFNFASNQAKPYSLDGVRNGMFLASNSVANYYSEVTFGKWGITGDVFDYVTIPNEPTSCAYDTFSNAAAQMAAQQRGFVRSNYTNVMYFFPQPAGCSGYWWGDLGGPESWHMLNDSYFLRHSAHELGHNFGRHHANSYNCSGVTLGTSCSSSEYGDPHSIMGQGGVVKHFTAFHKAYNTSSNPTWLASSNMRTITSSGQYTLEHVAAPTAGTQLIRIPRGSTGQFIYLTYRQPYGYDNFSAGSAITTGVSLHLAGDYTSMAQSQLLDASPDGNFGDSTLKPGQTFTDPVYGATVQVVSADAAGAVLEITVQPTPCTQSNPSLSISPSSITAEPGQTVSYTFTLRNNNGSTCGNSTFSIVPTLAAGLSQTPASFSETLASGASVTRTFMVTSDPLITTGTKSITQRATSGSYTASASASYVIPTPPAPAETVPPTVTITSPANGSRISGNANVSVSASDASGIATIAIQIDGKTVKTCNGATTCVYKWNTRKTANGTHTIKAIAVDKSSNANRAETSITVTK